jgi:hypothetical protein
MAATASASLNTVERLIRFALEDSGRIARGGVPSSEQYAVNMQRLQDLVYAAQTQGCKLFLLVDTPVPLVANTATYTIGVGGAVNMAKPWKVEEAYYLDPTGNSRPLNVSAWKDWVHLANKNTTGQINTVFVDKQVSLLNVGCWNVPDANAALGTVQLVLRTQLTGYISLTDTTMFPVEWFLALRWMLADELSVGQPTVIMQRCAQNADKYRIMLEAWDVEDVGVTFTRDA